MTRQEESNVRFVFRAYIDKACEELCEKGYVDGMYWPNGYAERLAELCTQAVAFANEACVATEEEVCR